MISMTLMRTFFPITTGSSYLRSLHDVANLYPRRIFGIKWGDAETQVVISSDLENTDDEDNLRARMLAARKAELAARHRPRPQKGKQHASSTDIHASELSARDSSIEFVEASPPSDPGSGSAEGGAGAGTSDVGDCMAS